jgi:hypothetical protein
MMTVTSPLVWYHTNIFLVPSLAFLVGHRRRRLAIVGLLLVFLIQIERPIEVFTKVFLDNVRFAGATVVLAHLVLLGTMVALYARTLADQWHHARR